MKKIDHLQNSIFDNRILLITGGTGSFGTAILKRFIDSDLREIRIFSRDEKKQDDLRGRFKDPKIRFYLGDVRDERSVHGAMEGVDFVFHAAALKQVPSCEFFPMQAFKTNVLGTENVLDSAIQHKVKNVVVLSTDKAVYPINAMGLSKAMMEKVMIAKSLQNRETQISATRYGNVIASRGSVVPLFISQILEKKPITITNSNMTRYMMTLDEAVDLVLYAFNHGQSGDIFVQKSPAATVEVLAKALLELHASKVPIQTIGVRHGEKLFETLVNREEMARAEEMDRYYRIPADNRSLNYEQYISKGSQKIANVEEYNSHNTRQLSIEEAKTLLIRSIGEGEEKSSILERLSNRKPSLAHA